MGVSIQIIRQYKSGIKAASIFLVALLSSYGLPLFLGFTWSPFSNSALPVAIGQEQRKLALEIEFDVFTPSSYTEPVNALLKQAYSRGRLPLWNPYGGLGLPLASDLESKSFFPLQIVQALLPHWTWDWFYLFRIYIAGLFAYVLLRRQNLSFLICVFGGLAFMFTGAFAKYLRMEELVNEAMLIPVLMIAADRLVERRTVINIFLYAAGIALCIYGGQPELGFLSILLTIFYIQTFSNAADGSFKGFFNSFFAVLSSIALGMILAFPQVLLSLHNISLAFTDYFGQSLEITRISAQPGFFEKMIGAPWPVSEYGENIVSILFPYFWGYEHRPWSKQIFDGKPWIFPHPGSIGLIVSFGIALAIFSYRYAEKIQRKKILFWGIAAFWMASANYGFPLTRWILFFPPLRNMGFARYSAPIFMFCCVILACFGFEFLNRSEESALKKRIFKQALFASMGLGLALFFFGIFIHWNIIPNAKTYFLFCVGLKSLFVGCALSLSLFLLAKSEETSAILAGLILLLYAESSLNILYGMELLEEAGRIGIFSVLCVAAILWTRRASKTIPTLLLTASLGALAFLICISPSSGLSKRYDFIKNSPPYVSFLQAKDPRQFRIFGIESPHYARANYTGAFGLYDIRTVTPLVPLEWARFLKHYIAPQQYHARFEGDIPHRSEREFHDQKKYYDYLGVKYILTNTGKSLPAGFPLVYDNEVRIFENPQAFPRAYMVYDVRASDSEEEIFKEISNLDLRHSAYILDRAGSKQIIKNEKGGENTVEIAEYFPERVVLKVQSAVPGLLVLTDLDYPGWTCDVDGKRQKIQRTNGLVRGVWVGTGIHEIIFEYSMTEALKSALSRPKIL